MGVEELLDATDEEDFTEELEDFTELLLCLLLDDEFTDELDLAELLLDPSTPALPPLRMTLDEEHGMTTEEEDLSRFSVVAEDDIQEELLDSRSGSGMTEEDDSSSSSAELSALFSPGALVELESSPQALKVNSAKATALTKPIFLIVFIQNLLILKSQSYLRNTPCPQASS